MDRRNFLLTAASAMPVWAVAQTRNEATQERPARLIVPYAAGGGADSIGRLIASALSTRQSRTYYVENKGGAGGSIGTAEAARSSGQIDTLLLATTAIVSINPEIYQHVNYDVTKDFVAVAGVCDAPLVVITSANSKAANLADYVAASRKSPGEMFFASSGNGTIAHVAVALLNDRLKAGFTHVPYGGEAAAVAAVLAGQQPIAYYSTLATALPLIRAGRVRALGIPSPVRDERLPEVPTLKEQGLKDVDVAFWYGLLAPSQSRQEWLRSVQSVVLERLADASFAEKVASAGFTPTPMSQEKFQQRIASDIATYRPLARSLGLQLG